MTRTRLRTKGFVGRCGICVMMLLLVGSSLIGCKDKQQVAQRGVPEVAYMEVTPQRVVLTQELPGRTCARLVAEIRPQATGIITERLFTEGALVEEGELLYRIDPKSYEAAYANAEAAVSAAKANYSTSLAGSDVAEAALSAAKASEVRADAAAAPIRLREQRFKELLEGRAVSQQDYDEAFAALKQADAEILTAAAAVQSAQAEVVRAQALVQAALAAMQTAEAGLETARINLDYTEIKSPISGHIGRSSVTTGALVTANQPVALATVQQLDPIYVDVPQATAELLRLQQRLTDGTLVRDVNGHAKAKLMLENGQEYPLAGQVEFREISVNPTTGSFVMRLVFPNPDGILLPGMFVRAVIEEGVKEDAVLVPQHVILRTGKGEPYVLTVTDENTVGMRMINIDRAIGNTWLVTSGLSAGDRVIVEGLQKVRPGVPVKAVAAEGDKEPAQASAN